MDQPNAIWKNFERAARGELSAQRLLARHFEKVVLATGDIGSLFEGVAIARLAVAQGDRTDVGKLLTLFGLALVLFEGKPEFENLGREMAAEAMAWLSTLANRGDEYAADQVNKLADWTTPQVLEWAAGIEALIDGKGN